MTEHSKEVMEKRRAAFEAHIAAREGSKFHAAWDLSRDGDGYEAWQTHRSWEDWNAALDSVEIELPAKFNGDHGGCIHDAGVHDDVIDECREAIESTGLGLRVKS